MRADDLAEIARPVSKHRCLTVVCLAAIVTCLCQSCGDSTADAGNPDAAVPVLGLTSGATCISESPLNYISFGREFMSEYCLRCHTVNATGATRKAPIDRNFDDLVSIRRLAFLIDQQAAAGPAAVHSVMPPNEPVPTLDQRDRLGQWLACGAP